MHGHPTNSSTFPIPFLLFPFWFQFLKPAIVPQLSLVLPISYGLSDNAKKYHEALKIQESCSPVVQPGCSARFILIRGQDTIPSRSGPITMQYGSLCNMVLPNTKGRPSSVVRRGISCGTGISRMYDVTIYTQTSKHIQIRISLKQ